MNGLKKEHPEKAKSAERAKGPEMVNLGGEQNSNSHLARTLGIKFVQAQVQMHTQASTRKRHTRVQCAALPLRYKHACT